MVHLIAKILFSASFFRHAESSRRIVLPDNVPPTNFNIEGEKVSTSRNCSG
jgi:hypothetical protein